LQDWLRLGLCAGQSTAVFCREPTQHCGEEVPDLIARGETEGPTDHSCGARSLRDNGLLKGPSCSVMPATTTTMDYYKWSALRRGSRRSPPEKAILKPRHVFLMAGGGDQNPMPRRKFSAWAERYTGTCSPRSRGSVLKPANRCPRNANGRKRLSASFVPPAEPKKELKKWRLIRALPHRVGQNDCSPKGIRRAFCSNVYLPVQGRRLGEA